MERSNARADDSTWPATGPVRRGRLAGPVVGLRFESPSCSGLTDSSGTFEYRDGEILAFSVGSVVVGVAQGADRLTLADLVPRVDGEVHKLADPGLTNIARFLYTLDEDGDADNGITLSPRTHEVVGDRLIDFRYRAMTLPLAPVEPVAAFAQDPVVLTLLRDLGRELAAGGQSRVMVSAASARNAVRRTVLGIRRVRDIEIPRRNGSVVFADVYRPDTDEPVPVIMNCGVYGRAFVHHTVCDPADLDEHEAMEERYFFGNADGYEFENHESANPAQWVPRGYAVVRVDGPGAGRSPGTLGIWGIDEAEAFHDAIEWAGEQAWSNGNVGLWGMSYYAVNQHAVASLRPSHLKAMIAIGTDTDLYEELIYTGGILNEQFFPMWFASGIVPAVCGEVDAHDFMSIARANPFKDSNPDEIFGPRAKVLMSPDMSQVTVPLWTVAATTHPSHFHQLGSSETYLNTSTSAKKIDFWEDWFMKPYSRAAIDDHAAFFDHWLKGVANGVMDTPPVRLEVRAGRGSSFLLTASEWPVPGTEYVRWYLDAAPVDVPTGLPCDNVLGLARKVPTTGCSVTYSAQVDATPPVGPPARMPGVTAPCRPGATFVSAPMEADTVIAGYSKLVAWVSSSAADMDLYVSVRVLDQDGQEVDYVGPALIPGIATQFYPLAKGWLKVSHRVLDPERSTEFRPKHTHRQADHAPLSGGEIVPVEVEIIPNAGLIKKGHRLRVDLEPFTGAGHGMRHAYDPTYHDGAQNTIHTGPEHPSYIQLPVVPQELS